jgi:hypothetical protein
MFCVGVAEGGKYYISISVSNSLVDYEEYYRAEKAVVGQHPKNIEFLKNLANKCRRRLNYKAIILTPGSDRGIPMWPEESP